MKDWPSNEQPLLLRPKEGGPPATEVRRMEAEYAELAARVERHRLEVIEITSRIDELRQSIAELELKANRVAEERAHEEQEIADSLWQPGNCASAS